MTCKNPLSGTSWVTPGGYQCDACHELRQRQEEDLNKRNTQAAQAGYTMTGLNDPPTLADVVMAIERQTAVLRELQVIMRELLAQRSQP